MFSGSSTDLQKAPRNHLLKNLRNSDDCVRQLPQRFRDLHLLNYLFLFVPEVGVEPTTNRFWIYRVCQLRHSDKLSQHVKELCVVFFIAFQLYFQILKSKNIFWNFCAIFFRVFQIQVNYTIRILFWKIFFNFFEKFFCTYGRIRTPESLV